MCQGIHADFYIKINFSNSIYLYRNLSYPQVFIYEIFFSQYYHRVEISLQLHSTVIYTNLYLWMTEIKKKFDLVTQAHTHIIYTRHKDILQRKIQFLAITCNLSNRAEKNNYQQLILSCTTIYIILKLLFFPSMKLGIQKCGYLLSSFLIFFLAISQIENIQYKIC